MWNEHKHGCHLDFKASFTLFDFECWNCLMCFCQGVILSLRLKVNNQLKMSGKQEQEKTPIYIYEDYAGVYDFHPVRSPTDKK